MKINILSVKFFMSLFMVLAASKVYSETIVDGSGKILSGRIGEFSQNGVQLFGDQYWVLQLDNIRDARVDSVDDETELNRQQMNVHRLLKVIDQDKFIRRDLGDQIRGWLFQKKYAELDALAENLIQTEQRFPSGGWKIYAFYKVINIDIGDRDVANNLKRVALIEDWIVQNPASVTAKICLMEVLRNLAWAYRGSGLSNTVTNMARQNFKTNLKKVIDIGNELRAAETNIPGLYSPLISASNGYGIEKAAIIALAKESAAINPYYFGSFSSTIHALVPKWGGKPGEIEAFADWVSGLTGSPAGLEMYFWLALSIQKFAKDSDYKAFGFDWSKIEQGFKEYRNNYHTTDLKYNQMAKLASLHGDKEAARKYFSLTDGEWNHYAHDVWGTPDTLKEFQIWSLAEPDINFKKILAAILKQEFPLINYLLEQYLIIGDLNETDVDGNTLIHLLVEAGQYKSVIKLIGSGADLNMQNILGYTPLHIAAQLGRTAIAKSLLANGADSTTRSFEFKNGAIHYAAMNGFEEIVRVLLTNNESLLNFTNRDFLTPLHRASLNGYTKVIKLLLMYPQLERNAQNNHRDTPLHLAVLRGHRDIVELLVEHGANPDIKNSKNHTALSLAKEQAFTQIISYLESKNAADSNQIISDEDIKSAVNLYKNGSKHYSEPDFQQAKILYLEALNLNPNFALAYHSLGIGTWQFEHDPKTADEYMNKAIELDPNFLESYYWLGRINYDLGRPEVFRPLFQKYVNLAPHTFNTKDLQQNYASLLIDPPAEEVPAPNSTLFFLNKKPSLFALSILLAVLLAVVFRRRKNSNKDVIDRH